MSQNKIINYLDQLDRSLNIRQEDCLKAARISFKNGLYLECIRDLKRRIFKLNCKLRIKFINKTMNDEEGPACVKIPENLPTFFSPLFSKTIIEIEINNILINDGFSTFITVIAHELSHILLHSIKHNLMRSEKATDLTVMVLGLAERMKIERESSTNKYGYLDDNEFIVAYNFIKKRRKIILL